MSPILQIKYVVLIELSDLSKAQIQDLNPDLSDYKTHILPNTSCPSPRLLDSETLRFMHAFQGSFMPTLKEMQLVIAGFNYCTRWNNFSPKITPRL